MSVLKNNSIQTEKYDEMLNDTTFEFCMILFARGSIFEQKIVSVDICK